MFYILFEANIGKMSIRFILRPGMTGCIPGLYGLYGLFCLPAGFADRRIAEDQSSSSRSVRIRLPPLLKLKSTVRSIRKMPVSILMVCRPGLTWKLTP